MLPVVGIAIGVLSIAGVFMLLRLATPFDGAWLEPAQPVWKTNGVIVKLPEDQPDGLQDGDLVVAIDGRSLESWAQTIFQAGGSRPDWQFGQKIVYTVIRDGQQRDVSVVLRHYPLGAILSRSWGVFVFLLPFLFVLTPSLLMDGSVIEIVFNFSRVLFGIWLGTIVRCVTIALKFASFSFVTLSMNTSTE